MSENATNDSRVIPQNFGPLKGANGNARMTGPCGDTMEFWARIEEDQIADCTFTSDGCDGSITCGSLVAKMVLGVSHESAFTLEPAEVLSQLPDLPAESEHCVLLALSTLRAAISRYRAENCSGESCSSCDKTGCDSRSKPAPAQQENADEDQGVSQKLSKIKNKIVVLSGKGGVGKSTVSVNLAMGLALAGKRVGLLDIDIHGPSVPVLLGLEGERLQTCENELVPISIGNLSVMSIGFLLQDKEDAIIWRGPRKASVIQQFVENVAWGELDYLIVDCPPGTGDEPLSICQILGQTAGAIIVTTPQDVAAADVRRSVTFCNQIQMPIVGVIENMSGFKCPHCGETTEIFKSGGGLRLAKQFDIPFLGSLPIAPEVGILGDEGRAFVGQSEESSASEAFSPIIKDLLKL
jgi:ATP-binding protein involved in chromosome partitioning